MKFLKADGTIEEGTPITDEQIRLRDTVVEYLHEKMCHGAYHSHYSLARCEEAGKNLAGILDQFNGESRLCDVIAAALPHPEPIPDLMQPQPLVYEEAELVKPGSSDDDLPL